ncbi:hypothetical protein, partial [Klebsiella pneumoniae]|uniref:hypothetical protein n=1 Tax=Klebsiella pneumoniae TaxID=573 RepID=UPI00214CF759
FNTQTGPAIVASLIDLGDRFRLLVNTIETVPTPHDLPKLPVASSLMGLGAFPATHSQALGMLGMHGTYEANMTMHHSDV